MESLTKQNFWNDLMEKYPDEMKKFCAWIDQYKSKHAWVLLFSGDQIKYHDLPIAMQTGIFIEFTMEVGYQFDLPKRLEGVDGWKTSIRDYFDKLHKFGLNPTFI